MLDNENKNGYEENTDVTEQAEVTNYYEEQQAVDSETAKNDESNSSNTDSPFSGGTFTSGNLSGNQSSPYFGIGDNRQQNPGQNNTQNHGDYQNQYRSGQSNGVYPYNKDGQRNSYQQGNGQMPPYGMGNGTAGNGSQNHGDGGWKKVILGVFLGVVFGAGAVGGFFAVNNVMKNGEGWIEETITTPVEEKGQGIPEVADVIEESKSEIAKSEPVTNVTQTVTDVTQVVDAVMPSVVSITNNFIETQDFFGQRMESEVESSGSGIIIGQNETELLIVTNNHVIADAETLHVQFINESVVEAKTKGTDASMDLAVVAVALEDLDEETMSSISVATLGDSDSLKVGEPAIAIGNALGYGQSVTTGVISALNRSVFVDETGEDANSLIQTDAAINPGNSGGALLNVKGEVIGINSNKIGGTVVEGMGYAIPISSATPIIEELKVKETRYKVDAEEQGYLGISGINVTADVAAAYGMPEGAYVAQAYEGYAAQKAGILKGDIITEFDGETVGNMEQLQGYLKYYAIGDQVTIVVQRQVAGGYEEHTMAVVLGKAVESTVEE